MEEVHRIGWVDLRSDVVKVRTASPALCAVAIVDPRPTT